MVYLILLMSLPLLGWTILGIIPNKYLNQLIDGKKKAEPTKELEPKKTKPLNHWAKFAEEKK